MQTCVRIYCDVRFLSLLWNCLSLIDTRLQHFWITWCHSWYSGEFEVLFCFALPVCLHCRLSFMQKSPLTYVFYVRLSQQKEHKQETKQIHKKQKQNMLYKYPACIVIYTILVTFIVVSPIGICFCPDNIVFGKILWQYKIQITVRIK